MARCSVQLDFLGLPLPRASGRHPVQLRSPRGGPSPRTTVSPERAAAKGQKGTLQSKRTYEDVWGLGSLGCDQIPFF